jgi:hypothetical protein
VLAVVSRVHERQRAHPGSTSELCQPRNIRAELIDVAASELREAAGLVAEPLSELTARRKVLRPLIELGLPFGDTAWPEAIDENAVSVPCRRGLVGPLQADVY